MIIAQGLPQGVSPVELYVFMAIVLAGLGIYKLVLGIQVSRKQLAAPPQDGRRTLDQPLITKLAEEFVKVPDFTKKIAELKSEIGYVEKRIDDKFEGNVTIFRERFHKLDNDLNALKLAAMAGREIATEQFQNIEGRLGELRATVEHVNASAIRTQQSVERLHEKLPETIANALSRAPQRRA